MALMFHQMQNYVVAFPSCTSPWVKGGKITQQQTMLRMLSSAHMSTTWKRVCSLRLRNPAVQNARTKGLKVLSFNGDAKKYESGDGLSNSKLTNNTVRTSYLPHDCEEPVTNSPRLRDKATINLFTKWLSHLRMMPLDTASDDTNSEDPKQEVVSQPQNGTHDDKETANVAKMALYYNMPFDATIKISLMIFVPFYLVVNVVYGAAVSRELTPLWICGPLVTALYAKLFQWIISLYVFTFKRTVHVLKKLPIYFLLLHQYVFAGKLKDEIRDRLWQPLVDVKNVDFKRLMREIEEWISDKFLDYLESIWPYYCRTVRFLKRANFI